MSGGDDGFDDIIRRSSFGTDEARRHRRNAPPEGHRRVYAAVSGRRDRRALRRDDVGARVREVQWTLARLGRLPDDAVTGEFDDQTVYGVLAFQLGTGGRPTGEVDAETWAALVAASATGTRPPGQDGLRTTREATSSRIFPDRAMTQGELARLMREHVEGRYGVRPDIDRRYVAELEAGTIDGPNGRDREALRSILHPASDEDLGFGPAAGPRRRLALGFGPAAGPRRPLALDTVDRHLVAAASAAYLERLDPRRAGPAGAGAEAIHRAFAHPGSPAADWAGTAEARAAEYLHVGARTLQARLTADLFRLRDALGTDPELWGVAACLLTTMGLTLPLADEPAGAPHWYRLAAAAADRSGDRRTRTWVRGRAALALAYEGDGLGLARRFAEEALALSDVATPGRQAALLALAHAHGIEGRADRARHALDEALSLSGRLVGAPPGISDFSLPEWRLAVIASMLLARLGDEGPAEAMQRLARRTMPPSLPRFAIHLELHRALMIVRRHDPAAGVQYAQDALGRLAPTSHSRSLDEMLREIERSA